ncbi:hypothetical protein GLYMA_06G079050v4 [Glycine max]|nr:hypothetical protein GLYMA_06G079050v4 [Glycine max]KAH1124712.1 hypothetical protein GYH30_014412 [Glycine max]
MYLFWLTAYSFHLCKSVSASQVVNSVLVLELHVVT